MEERKKELSCFYIITDYVYTNIEGKEESGKKVLAPSGRIRVTTRTSPPKTSSLPPSHPPLHFNFNLGHLTL